MDARDRIGRVLCEMLSVAQNCSEIDSGENMNGLDVLPHGRIDYGSAMAKLARALVMSIALFVTLDAVLCPVLCLQNESQEHRQAPSSQNSSSSACGACTCALAPGLTNVAVRPLDPLLPGMIGASALDLSILLSFDIDHPPRLL